MRDRAQMTMPQTGLLAAGRTPVVPFSSRWATKSMPNVLIITRSRDRDLLQDLSGMMFVDPGDLTAAVIGRAAPDLVVSALISGGHDACDMASALQTAGYRGRYRVATGPLPHPGLVLDEVRAAGPDIDIDFLEWPI